MSEKKLLRYVISLSEEEDGEEGKTFIRQFAVTARPVMQIKGVAYSEEEEKEVFYSDESKMRIFAPAIIPGVHKYKDRKTGEWFEVEFTQENVDAMHADIMSHPQRLVNLFNDDHKAGSSVDCYLLEVWQVEESETDKSNKIYGVILPKGTICFIMQYRTKEAYDWAVENKATGLSLEGRLKHVLKMSLEEEKKKYSDFVVLNEQGEALMLLRSKDDDFEPEKWTLPGGKIDEGETPEEAAIRELKEETNLSVKDKEQEVRSIGIEKNQDGSETNYFALITDQTLTPEINEESDGFKWVKTDEIEKMPVVMGQNERIITVVKKAVELKEKKEMEEGQKFQIGEKWFIVKNGEPIPYEEETEETELSNEETEMSEEEKKKKEEELKMAEQAAADAAAAAEKEETDSVTMEDVKKEIETQFQGFKKEIEETVSNSVRAVVEELKRVEPPKEEEMQMSLTEEKVIPVIPSFNRKG